MLRYINHITNHITNHINMSIYNQNMDLTKLINLYTEINKLITSDNHYVAFRVRKKEFIPDIFKEESDFLWQKNKDVVIGFSTKNNISHNVLLSYNNNNVEYFTYFTDDKELTDENNSDKCKFNDVFKKALHENDISGMIIILNNDLTKEKISACIKIFVILLSLYHEKIYLKL